MGNTMNLTMFDIAARLRTQDNRMTMNPMFCVQIKVRDRGYDTNYGEDTVWVNMESGDYEECSEETPGAEEFGYVDRWETVMVAFTEAGCEEFMQLNGHNVKRCAHNGETRIYVESFNRCPEMIAIRNFLLAPPLPFSTHIPPVEGPCLRQAGRAAVNPLDILRAAHLAAREVYLAAQTAYLDAWNTACASAHASPSEGTSPTL